MKLIKQMGISQKLLLITIITIFFAVSMTGGIGYFVASSTIIYKLKSVDIKNIVEIKASKVESRLSRAIETSKLFASDPAVTEWFEGREADGKLGVIVKKKLTQLQHDHDYFTSFAVSNRTNHYWTADNKLLDTVSKNDPDDSWFFRSVSINKRFEINIDYNKELGETGVFLNVIVGDLKDPAAVAGVGFRLDEVINDLFKSQEGYSDSALLINKEGIILISLTKEDIGKKISEIYPESVSKAILSESKGITVVEYEDLKNDDNMIMGFTAIKSSDLIVIDQMPVRSLLKSLDKIALVTILSAIVSIVLVIIVFMIFGNRIIKHPVKKIIDFVEMLSGGDLSVRLDLKQNDEFGRISRALNTSTSNLETLISEIIHSAENVSQAVGQIAAGNFDLSRRTSQQASALEEIAATIEENTSQVAKNAENASVAQRLTQDGADKSSIGSEQAVSAINSINEINESSKKISEIITVINEIAFQTNLLALNAAVEAARAGDQGKGFAVVAGEVRNLAQRSGTAAKEIEHLIKESVEKVESGTHLVVQTGDSLKEIAQSARTGADLLSEVAAASSEQMAGMQEINKAINELDSMTQENSALVEETSSASEEMSLQAGEMLKKLARFTISSKLK